MDGLTITKEEIYLNKSEGQKIDSGVYEISWKSGASENRYKLNFLMVIENGKIIAHHSSHQDSHISISRWVDEKDEGNFVM